MPDPKQTPKESKAVAAAKAWVAALPEKQRSLYAATLADAEAAEQLGQSVLMQSDYTRGIQEARAKEQEAATLQERLKKETADWYAANKPLVDAALAENEKLKGLEVSYSTRMKRLAVKYGIDEADLKDVVKADAAAGAAGDEPENLEASATVGAKGQDRRQYVDNDTFNSRLDNTIGLAAQFHDIEADHREMFPTEKLRMTTLVKEANEYANAHPTEQVSLQSFWEQKYKVGDRRAAIEQERIDKLVEQKAEEKYKARVGDELQSSLSLSGRGNGRASENGSPLLNLTKNGGLKSSDEGFNTPREDGSKDPMRGVRAAMADFEARQHEAAATT